MDLPKSFRDTCDRASVQLAFFAEHIGNAFPGTTDVLKTILQLAADFQQKVGTNGRLHIVYESSPPSPSCTSPSTQHQIVYSPFPQSLVCILFSSTVIFQGESRVHAATQLLAALNAFSLLSHHHHQPTPAPAMPSRPTGATAKITTATPAAPPMTSSPPTYTSPSPSPHPAHHFTIAPPTPPVDHPPPDWYPGHRYISGPQISDDALYVSERAFALFKPFDMPYVHKIYRAFFTRLHARIKTLRKGLSHGSVVYERFTPPWIRKKIVVGERGVTFGGAIIPDIHRMRNNAGTRRLKLLLAAFYEREPLARQVLDEILPVFVKRLQDDIPIHINSAQSQPVHTVANGGNATSTTATIVTKTPTPAAAVPCADVASLVINPNQRAFVIGSNAAPLPTDAIMHPPNNTPSSPFCTQVETVSTASDANRSATAMIVDSTARAIPSAPGHATPILQSPPNLLNHTAAQGLADPVPTGLMSIAEDDDQPGVKRGVGQGTRSTIEMATGRPRTEHALPTEENTPQRGNRTTNDNEQIGEIDDGYVIDRRTSAPQDPNDANGTSTTYPVDDAVQDRGVVQATTATCGQDASDREQVNVK